MADQTLEYSLIQYVGDPVRREAINVGVAVTGSHDVAVLIDRAAHVRLSAAWPSFDRRLYFAAVRDLRHLLADTHQLFLMESAVEFRGSNGASLKELSSSMANQFALTEPKAYLGTSARDAARHLFDRLVRITVRSESRRDRHMTRAALRSMISEVLSLWVSARAPDMILQSAAEIEGALAPHVVDLVAFEGAKPEMMFFAAPVAGAQASLIRDSLPTVIDDIKREFPTAAFYAVLGARGTAHRVDQKDPERVTRLVLSRVEGLHVLDLGEFQKSFASQAVAVEG